MFEQLFFIFDKNTKIPIKEESLLKAEYFENYYI